MIQAKDKSLEIDANEIRMRAERRLGEMISVLKRTVGLNPGNRLRGSSEEPRDNRPTLAESGIDKNLSSGGQFEVPPENTLLPHNHDLTKIITG